VRYSVNWQTKRNKVKAMSKKSRYPRTVDEGYYYTFAKYVADFGHDKAGVRDALTDILIDLGLDPKSLEDRKWAREKFRVANPSYYDPDDKKKSRCKQEYYDYFVIQSAISAANLVTTEQQNHNRADAGLQQLMQDLKVAARMANIEDMPADVAIKLYLETLKLKSELLEKCGIKFKMSLPKLVELA
jgi:hypothetical protein